jgi:hypothetical protein
MVASRDLKTTDQALATGVLTCIQLAETAVGAFYPGAMAITLNPAGSVWWTVVLGPLLEEVLKDGATWSWLAGVHSVVPSALFGLFELGVRMRAGESFGDRLQVLLFHVALSSFPLRVRWLLHAAWNSVVVSAAATVPLGLVTQRDVIERGYVPKQGMRDTCRGMDFITLPRCGVDFGTVDTTHPEACKPGPAIKPAGMYNPNFPPFVNRACWHNEAAAVITRVLRTTPWRRGFLKHTPDVAPEVGITGWWKKASVAFLGRWKPRFRAQVDGHFAPTPWSSWIKHFPPFRRALYEKFKHVRFMEQVGEKERWRKSFIKKELGCRHCPALPEPPSHDPRLIQGAQEEWSVRSCLELHGYTKLLARVFHARERYFYVSGSSCEDVGSWLAWAASRIHGELIMLTIDAKRFDSSVTPPAMAHHHSVLEMAGVPKRKVRELRRREGMNKGRTARGVRYSFEAEVSSGHGDTSSCDSTVSLTIIDSMVQEAPLSPPEHQFGDEPYSTCEYAELLAAVNGDDNTALTTQAWLASRGGEEGIKARYELAGFDVTLSVNQFPFGDFCSQLFWPVLDDSSFVLGPKIGRTLCKTFYDFRARPLARHAKTVAVGLLTTCSYVPILRAVVERTLQLTKDLKLLRVRDQAREKLRASQRHECDVHRAAALVWHRYGLQWSDVLELEAMVLAAPCIPYPLLDPRLDRICAVDWELDT